MANVGRTAGTVALTYDYGQFNLTGALSYGLLGEATAGPQTEFNDGTVWAAALGGYSFSSRPTPAGRVTPPLARLPV